MIFGDYNWEIPCRRETVTLSPNLVYLYIFGEFVEHALRKMYRYSRQLLDVTVFYFIGNCFLRNKKCSARMALWQMGITLPEQPATGGEFCFAEFFLY